MLIDRKIYHKCSADNKYVNLIFACEIRIYDILYKCDLSNFTNHEHLNYP